MLLTAMTVYAFDTDGAVGVGFVGFLRVLPATVATPCTTPELCTTPDELAGVKAVRSILDGVATLVGPLAAAALLSNTRSDLTASERGRCPSLRREPHAGTRGRDGTADE